jgi:hypothetical protein
MSWHAQKVNLRQRSRSPRAEVVRLKKPAIEKPAFAVPSLTLTRADEDILEHISNDATDFTGRKISGSAMIRALLRHVDQQGYQWLLSQLRPFIDAEISSGVVWGKRK